MKLADAVVKSYGPEYQRASTYLRELAAHRLGRDVPLTPLPWHAAAFPADGPAAPYEPHPCVQAVLTPSVPLRAVWRRVPQVERPPRMPAAGAAAGLGPGAAAAAAAAAGG